MRRWPLVIVIVVVIVASGLTISILLQDPVDQETAQAELTAQNVEEIAENLRTYEDTQETLLRTLPPAARDYCRLQGGRIVTIQELEGPIEQCVIN